MPDRRGFVLLAVIIVVVLAAMMGTTVLYRAGAEVELARAASAQAAARALAWSGVQAVMAELASQRQSLLDGSDPDLTDSWTIVEDDRGRRGLYRLVPFPDGALARSEAARLNINHAPPDLLAAHPAVGPDLAGRIVSLRQRLGRFSSVDDLIDPAALTWDDLHAPRGEQPPLADALTVFSADPNVQAGVGRDGRSHRGEFRVNVNAPWSDRLQRAMERRWGTDAARGLQAIKQQGVDLSSLGAICRFLKNLSDEDDLWIGVLDSLTTTDDLFVPALIDINRADADALAAIPGIGTDAARQIVDRRDALDDATRTSVYWPVQEGILDIDALAQAVDYITVRSLQWRVRVEAGYLPVEESSGRFVGQAAGAGQIGGLLADEPPLSDRVVIEAVIEVASERPRVAYLRDITSLDLALALRDSAEPSLPDADQPQDDPLLDSDDDSPAPDRPTLERPTWDRPTRTRTPTRAAPDQPVAAGDASDSATPADPRTGRWTVGKGGGR